MKTIFVTFAALGVIAIAVLGSMLIFGFSTFAEILALAAKIFAAHLLLAGCSALLSLLVSASKKD